MKYKKGDLVKIKTWEQMVDEYGLTGDGTIMCATKEFLPDMKHLCGTIQEITSAWGGGTYNVGGDVFPWDLSAEMIAHKVGEVGGVSNTDLRWKDGIFLPAIEDSDPEQEDRNFKITIEHYDLIISVGVDRPDVVLIDAIRLMKNAFLACGYSKKQLDEYIPKI